MKLLQSYSINKIFRKLNSKFPEIKEALIISNEGMPLKSILSDKFEHVKISGIALAILSAAEKIISETNNGRFKELKIKCSNGYILGHWIKKNLILLTFSEKDVNLESII